MLKYAAVTARRTSTIRRERRFQDTRRFVIQQRLAAVDSVTTVSNYRHSGPPSLLIRAVLKLAEAGSSAAITGLAGRMRSLDRRLP